MASPVYAWRGLLPDGHWGPRSFLAHLENGQKRFLRYFDATGVGLANTRARLAGLYGAAATLSLEAADPRGVTARVRMPWRRAAQATPSLAAEGAT